MNDFDGDGILNADEQCVMGGASGIDEDHDGVDDVCDGEMNERQTITVSVKQGVTYQSSASVTKATNLIANTDNSGGDLFASRFASLEVSLPTSIDNKQSRLIAGDTGLNDNGRWQDSRLRFIYIAAIIILLLLVIVRIASKVL